MTVKLKMELKWSKIKRVVTIPCDLNLFDLHFIIQAMFGFDHEHLWDFVDKNGREYNTCRTPLGDPLDLMDTSDKFDPEEYTIEEVLPNRGAVIVYTYDYGNGWRITIRRMADPKTDEIACIETVGTNALEDIGGAYGLEAFTQELKECKLNRTEGHRVSDEDCLIVSWGFDDPESRRIFLEGPTTTELTELLRKQIRGSGVTNAIEDE